MEKTLAYLILTVSSILLFSCSNEEIIPAINKDFVEMPISIGITLSSQTQLETKAMPDELAGTCNTDKVLLLVYSGSTTITDRRLLTYHSQQTLECVKEGNQWVARGSITGNANMNYSIFAIAYNSGDLGNFEILPDPLREGITTYGDTKVSLKYTATPSSTLNSYNTPEFFVGNVIPQGAMTDVFLADGEVKLTGILYRAVGKIQFNLTNIPANIKKVSLLSEKIAEYNILYRISDNGTIFSKYPMGIPPAGELRKYVSEIAKAERVDNAIWQATLQSFLIPLTESLLYVDATDDNDNTTRYLIKCADQKYNSIWIYVIGYGVESYRFSIPPNYQIRISGEFQQLQNSGNVLIDLSNMEEFDGGFLPVG